MPGEEEGEEEEEEEEEEGTHRPAGSGLWTLFQHWCENQNQEGGP